MEDGSWRDDLITVTPTVAAPGEVVSLRFPDDHVRGIGFTLSVRREGGWEVAYYLVSDALSADARPRWLTAEEGVELAVPAIGITGPHPDHVVVPETAPEGAYLLCQETGSGRTCARLTVSR